MSWADPLPEDEAQSSDEHSGASAANFHTVNSLVAAGLGSRTKLLNEASSGRLKGKRFGRVLIFTDEAVREWLAELPDAAKTDGKRRKELARLVDAGAVHLTEPVHALTDARVRKTLEDFRAWQRRVESVQ